MTLYEHQKEIYTAIKQPNPKLIFYIAPTGTGKTLSPLGLSNGYRIIFVCVARHIGLALAKAAISMEKKVAFANRHWLLGQDEARWLSRPYRV